MELKYKISYLYPEVGQISVKAVEDNGWPWNRVREFTYGPDTEASFEISCPRPKCLGSVRGINFRQAVDDMVTDRETHKRQRFNCRGYGHCPKFCVNGNRIQL